MSIKTFAQEEGISFNEAVRRLVDVALHKLGKKKTPTETLLEWADDTFSGTTDLSSNDDYLYSPYQHRYCLNSKPGVR